MVSLRDTDISMVCVAVIIMDVAVCLCVQFVLAVIFAVNCD